MCKCWVKILVITESNGGRPPTHDILMRLMRPHLLQLYSSHTLLCLKLLHPSLRCRPLALTGPLRATSLHLLCRESTKITARGGITALREPLLAAEPKFLVLLLALQIGCAIAAGTATLAAPGRACVLDRDIKEVIGVVGGSRGVSLALCNKNVLAIV